MKKLFNYCVCAIAYVYKKYHRFDGYLAQGYCLFFFSLTLIILSIVEIILVHYGKKMSLITALVLLLPTIFEILFFEHLFPNSKKLFDEFENRKDDKLRWLKITLVMLFVNISIIFFAVVLFKCQP